MFERKEPVQPKNWPNLVWCKDRWNVYSNTQRTLYSLSVLIFGCFCLPNVNITECTYEKIILQV